MSTADEWTDDMKRHGRPFFCKAAGVAFPMDQITRLDLVDIENLRATVWLKDGTHLLASDIEALELVMQVKPSALEGKRLAYARRAWWIHNMLAHPAMQVLAGLGLYSLAFRVHDATVPRPKGAKPHALSESATAHSSNDPA